MTDKVQVQPIANMLLVELIKNGESVSEGGLILPETVSKNIAGRAHVLAVGSEAKYIKEGDVVILAPNAEGRPIDMDKQRYLMSELDCLGICVK